MMFPQYGDTRYPPGFGSGQGQIPMDPTAGGGRYGYPAGYVSKGPEGSQFGGMSGLSRGAQHYGGKPGAMASQEAMYGHTWGPTVPGQPYMSPLSSKQIMGVTYPTQPDMYSRMPPAPGYDSIPPYPGAPSYGASMHYASQYPYGSQRSVVPPGMTGPGGMVGHMMDGYPEGMRGAGGGGTQGMPSGGSGSVMSYPSGGAHWTADPSRRSSVPPGMNRGWSQEVGAGQPGSPWPYRSPDNYPPGDPSTPRQQQQPPAQSQTQSQQQQQPQQESQSQMYRQQSQQSYGAMSPQTPSYSSNPELQKQTSVSSLRDALLSSTPSSVSQQPPPSHYNSTRVPTDHQRSPMTPSSNIPPTPDALTPIGGTAVISPPLNPPSAFGERQDSQLSAEAESELIQSLSRHNSDTGMLSENPLASSGSARVSPFQVENILGIKNDKPVDSVGEEHRQAGNSGTNVMEVERMNSLQSPGEEVAPFGDHHQVQNARRAGVFNENSERGKQGIESNMGDRPEFLAIQSPTFGPIDGQPSPSLSEDGTAVRVSKARRTPVMSPVDRNHPSIVAQYAEDQQQKKDFLDTLFAFLENEGIPLVRLPTICRVPLDLYKAYNSVQQLGGFVNVIEKRLWREVLKSFNSGASNPHSGALRTLQLCYVKLLLPYECHTKNLDLSDCLSRFENSRKGSSVNSPSGEGEKVNHTPYTNTSKVEENVLNVLTEGKVNGESLSLANQTTVKGRLSQKATSQDSSDGSVVLMNSQSSQLSTDQESQPPQSQDHMLSPVDQKQDSLEIPEGSQNSVDTYSEGMSLTEPLPDISVQEAESLLGMSPSPYPTPTQPAVPTGPATPSGQNTPSPSYPPQFPQPNGQRGGDWGAPPPPPPNFLDMNDMSALGAAPNPPAYPPVYPVDPASGYRSHSSPIPPTYAAYPSHEMPPDFQAMQSPLMRSPYAGGSPYPGMPLPMHMAGHRGPMDSVAYGGPYRSPMMPQPSPMEIRRMEEMSAYASPTGMPMPPDWHWQQHRSRMLSSLPHHMQSPSPYHQQIQHHMQHRHSSSPRPLTQQPGSGTSSMQHHRSSPGQPLDPIKIHWQDQAHSKAQSISKVSEKPSASPKPTHRPEVSAENKTLQVRHLEHLSMVEGLKRPLPDWSNCVEGIKPQLVKRRRLFSGDCGHVEPWRVMMSLKSGLLAESTWALDTLNILLHDDRTVGFFYLKHHHSLLQTLIDHFKKALLAIFEENFEILPKYLPGREGAELEPCTTEGETKAEEARMAEWLLRANEMDYDVLSDVKSVVATIGNDQGEKKGETEELTNGSTVPVASVFSFGRMKLGKSDDLSHIRNPSAHDDLLYPSEGGGPEIKPESERRELERKSKLQRIDQTPVAELLHREALLSQVPLHRFGRLGRSPRRREKSFLEDIQMREEILKELEGDQRTESDSKSTECESKKRDLASSRNNGSSKMSGPNSKATEDSPKSPALLVEESEVYKKEPLPLWSISPVRELLQGRCLCISNILRSLSFIPGNDLEFSQNPGILILLGRLLTLHHCHLLRSKEQHIHTVVDVKQKENVVIADTRGVHDACEREENKKQCAADGEEALPLKEEEEMECVADEDQKLAPPCKENGNVSVTGKQEEPTHVAYRDYWWWECLEVLRENTLVILSNISGQLDLSLFPESISYPIVDGLLHWAVCPCAHAVDPLPETAMVFSLSPQRLVLETLAKMSISEVNVDFILATPPLMRLDLLFSHLVQFIGQKKHPVMRQFALVLLSNMSQGNESASRLIGQQKMVVFLLLECIEIAEHASCLSGGQLVGGHNPDDPNSLSVAMLRRAATTLHCLSKVPANRTAFLPYRDRMLYLATSQYVEPSVSSILMDMLFELGKL